MPSSMLLRTEMGRLPEHIIVLEPETIPPSVKLKIQRRLRLREENTSLELGTCTPSSELALLQHLLKRLKSTR